MFYNALHSSRKVTDQEADGLLRFIKKASVVRLGALAFHLQWVGSFFAVFSERWMNPEVT